MRGTTRNHGKLTCVSFSSTLLMYKENKKGKSNIATEGCFKSLPKDPKGNTEEILGGIYYIDRGETPFFPPPSLSLLPLPPRGVRPPPPPPYWVMSDALQGDVGIAVSSVSYIKSSFGRGKEEGRSDFELLPQPKRVWISLLYYGSSPKRTWIWTGKKNKQLQHYNNKKSLCE